MMCAEVIGEPLRNWYKTVSACPSCGGPVTVVSFNWLDKRLTFANWCGRCKDWEIQHV